MSNPKIIIIGAGLTGLTTAYLLRKKGIEPVILEASDRIGGRIETITGSSTATMEMGATWFGRQHTYLLHLLEELHVKYFKQHTQGISLFETMSFVPPQKFEIPDSEEPSYRIVGGTKLLIEKLISEVGLQNIKTQTTVATITQKGEQLEVLDANGNRYLAATVITTVPPNLLVNTIQFDPKLPQSLLQLAQETHTWMGESIKFAVEYASPFWRENGFSGTLFSQASIINEMYDHSTFDNNGFALKGFLNGGAHTFSIEDRKAKVIAQLVKCFGQAASNYVGYHEKVWREDSLVFYPYDSLVMGHQNNGHAIYQTPFLNDKLYISGSETAAHNPGYMDGAIAAAEDIASKF